MNTTTTDKPDAFVEAQLQIIRSQLLVGPVLISTCNARNWDIEKHLKMSIVADRLRAEGYLVDCSVSHGVTDYHVIKG